MLPLETPRLRVELNRSVFAAFLGPGSSNIMAGLESLVQGGREGGKGHVLYLMPWGIPLITAGLGCNFPHGQGLQLGGS